MLKQRNYIVVEKNKVFATKKAKVLIEALGETILASPEMTAKWELRLKEIGQGLSSPRSFMEQTKKLSFKVVNDAITKASNWNFSGLEYEVKASTSFSRAGKRFRKS